MSIELKNFMLLTLIPNYLVLLNNFEISKYLIVLKSFSMSFPIGSKYCNCPIDSKLIAYKNSNTQDEIYNVKYNFSVGDIVLVDALRISKFKAKILEILGNNLIVIDLITNRKYSIFNTEARIFLLSRCISDPCAKIDLDYPYLAKYTFQNEINNFENDRSV